MVLRCVVALAFGLALAMLHLGGWVLLERAVTPRVWKATGILGVAALVSALVAALATHLLRRHPWTARYAAGILILSAGTTGLSALLMANGSERIPHALVSLSLGAIKYRLIEAPAAALYGFLSVDGFILMPVGFPLVLLLAAFYSRRPRC